MTELSSRVITIHKRKTTMLFVIKRVGSPERYL